MTLTIIILFILIGRNILYKIPNSPKNALNKNGNTGAPRWYGTQFSALLEGLEYDVSSSDGSEDLTTMMTDII